LILKDEPAESLSQLKKAQLELDDLELLIKDTQFSPHKSISSCNPGQNSHGRSTNTEETLEKAG
jgi:hypothetical protein